MVVNVNPGNTVRVGFTLTNTGSPVSGVSPNQHYITVLFVNTARTDNFVGDVFSGAMNTGQAKALSKDLLVPLDLIPDTYNLEIDVYDPNNVNIASAVVAGSIAVAGIYSATITGITVTKV